MTQPHGALLCPKPGSEECLALQPLFDELHEQQDRERHDAAIAVAQRVLGACPDCPHARKDLARSLWRKGDYDEANRVLDALMPLGGESDAETLVLKGAIVDASQGPEAAIAWFKRAADIAPESHDPNCVLAEALLMAGREEEALDYARRARNTAPELDCGNLILIHLLRTLDKKTELRAVLPQARRVSSTGAYYWDQVARGYGALGKYRMALKLCDKALSLDPGFVGAHCLRADVYWAMERWDDTEKALLHLKQMDPENHAKFCLLSLAELHATKRSNLRLALDHIVQARMEFPDDEKVQQAYAEIADALARQASAADQERQDWAARLQTEREKHLTVERALKAFTPQEKGVPLAAALLEGEGQHLEFMDRFPAQARDLAKEIAAFSTSNDGTIFLGVQDDGTVCGIEALDSLQAKDNMRHRIGGLTSNAIRPPAQVEVYFLPYADKTVVKIFVPKGPEPVYYVEARPYLRHLDQSRPATHDEVTRLFTQHFSRSIP